MRIQTQIIRLAIDEVDAIRLLVESNIGDPISVLWPVLRTKRLIAPSHQLSWRTRVVYGPAQLDRIRLDSWRPILLKAMACEVPETRSRFAGCNRRRSMEAGRPRPLWCIVYEKL